MSEEEKKEVSRVLVTFDGFGSAHFSLNFDGKVSAQQMLGFAAQIKVIFGNEILSDHFKALEKAAQNKVAVPNQGIVLPS